MSEWQPIESAPKDGTLVLLYDPSEHEVVVGSFDHCLWHCATQEQPNKGRYGFDGFVSTTPTAWMPLPAPPTR